MDILHFAEHMPETIRQRAALDYLVYNAPLEYAELVLCGDLEGYLKHY